MKNTYLIVKITKRVNCKVMKYAINATMCVCEPDRHYAYSNSKLHLAVATYITYSIRQPTTHIKQLNMHIEYT